MFTLPVDLCLSKMFLLKLPNNNYFNEPHTIIQYLIGIMCSHPWAYAFGADVPHLHQTGAYVICVHLTCIWLPHR